ncbi:hypothetical protein [Capnocytophaga canimorsus]|uniref:Uncharacterized protein n=1 Tax=Capnocytophaga canimorsus (strain 5) TaxID=860228 RepID=F9YVZ9_CAPCC|nr:hypothetical protein [Capnocytophaga canimorsus]AEK24502.1 Conserved hypothetical protein [Capnocytophaga canimorsus Cc5]VEJ19505.1 Uncharacterised protein [Capnocytophaga canimorsus]
MKNITLLELKKYDNFLYEEVEKGIYKDLDDLDETSYRIALSFELEENETFQYPLEDILDKYFLYVSDFLDDKSLKGEKHSIIKVILVGELENIQSVKKIIGKRVSNQILTKEDGKDYEILKIE